MNSRVWDVQICSNINHLPVDMLETCKKLDIKTYTYMSGYSLIETFRLQDHVKNNDGFSTMINGNYVIFYNSYTRPAGRLRFTLAHELGHIALGHLDEDSTACWNGTTLWNNEENHSNSALEAAANTFASNFLAPACVLWALDIHRPQDIMNLCGLSKTASIVRAERMRELYIKESEWLMRCNKSCFLTEEKEKMVYHQFKPYIECIKARRNKLAFPKNGTCTL